jgi:HAMP domain-containing protein
VLTGKDESGMLARLRRRWFFPVTRGDQILMARRSDDGRYWFFLLIPRHRVSGWFLDPRYLWVLAAVIALCWALARYLTRPLRQTQAAIERFGRGDFSVRTRSRRRDELGELARTFDRMAEQIELLRQAERRLLLDVSHELRSPLARLGVAIELARSGEDHEAALDRLRKESERLNSLVEELLQVTRAECDPSALRAAPLRARARPWSCRSRTSAGCAASPSARTSWAGSGAPTRRIRSPRSAKDSGDRAQASTSRACQSASSSRRSRAAGARRTSSAAGAVASGNGLGCSAAWPPRGRSIR